MKDMFDAESSEAVQVGTCIMIEDDKIVYAGPLSGAPDPSGKHVMFARADFEKLKVAVERKRH